MGVSMATFGLITEASLGGSLVEFDKLLAKMQLVIDKANQPAEELGFWASLGTSIKDTATRLGDFSDSAAALGQRMTEDFVRGLVDVWSDASKGFDDFVKSFLANMAKMIAEMLLFNAIQKAIGLLQGAFTADVTVTNSTTGGNLPGIEFAEGGYVNGPHTMMDSVNAMLTPGEFVSDYKTVQHYGIDWFRAMKQQVIPRSVVSPVAAPPTPSRNFATGGPVVSTVSGSGATISKSVVVSDEQSFDRMLRGGRASLLEILGEEGFRPSS